MMQICITTQINETHFNSRILQEAAKLGVEVCFVDPYVADIPSGCHHILWRTTGVNYNDTDFDKITQNSVVSNPLETLKLCRDKWQLYQKLQNKLPLAYSLLLLPKWATCNASLKSLWPENVISTDFVLKTIRGHQGRGVELITSEAQWQNKLNELYLKNDWRYLIQPKLEGNEYRVFLLKNEAPIVLQRTAKTFQANFHQDGSAVEIKEIPQKLRDLIAKINVQIDYDYLALDIIGEDNPLIIDINAICGIEQLEMITK